MFDKIPGSETDRGPLWRATIAVLRGVVGGVLGTATMTVYRAPLFSGLPPTAEFWAQYIGGGEPEDYPIQALLLHFIYGAGAGGIFGGLAARSEINPVEGRASTWILLSSLYSVVLSVFGTRIVLRRLLDVELTGIEALVFHVGHVIYWLSLGTWLRTGTLIGRSDDDG